jgi:hypothetical protein
LNYYAIHKINLVEKGMGMFERNCWFWVSSSGKMDGSFFILNVVGEYVNM